jgi:hypothetical protein
MHKLLDSEFLNHIFQNVQHELCYKKPDFIKRPDYH